MEILVNQTNGITVVSLSGKLDAGTARDFQSETEKLLDGGCKKMIVDCKELQYISSAGLRVFYIILKRMSESRGTVLLSSPNNNVRRVFDIVSLSNDIRIFDDLEKARDNLE